MTTVVGQACLWPTSSAGRCASAQSMAQLIARLTALRFYPATGTYGPVRTAGLDGDRRGG